MGISKRLVAIGLLALLAPASLAEVSPGWEYAGPSGWRPTLFAAADASGDGSLDAIVPEPDPTVGACTPLIFVYLCVETPRTTGILALDGSDGSVVWESQLVGTAWDVRAADLGDGGGTDLFVTGNYDAAVLYDGNCAFDGCVVPRGRIYRLEASTGAIVACVDLEGAAGALAFADFNLDGIIDLALGAPAAFTAGLVSLSGSRVEAVDGRFLAPVPAGLCLPLLDLVHPDYVHWLGDVGFPAGYDSLQTGDLDGDGVPDAVVSELFGARLTALDGRDGSQLWSFRTDGSDSNGVAIGRAGGAAVVLSGKGSAFMAIDGPTGEVRWFTTIGQDARPLAYDGPGGPLAIAGAHASIAAFDLATGAPRWIFNMAAQGFSFPARDLRLADVTGDGAPELLASLHRGPLNTYCICDPGAIAVLDPATGALLHLEDLPYMAIRVHGDAPTDGPAHLLATQYWSGKVLGRNLA